MKKTFLIFLLLTVFPLAARAQDEYGRAVMASGLTVISRERADDLTSACLFIKVKESDEPAGKKGLTGIVNHTLLSCDPLGKGESPVLKVEQLGGYVTVETGQQFTCFTLSVPSKNSVPALKAFADMFISPDFSEAAVSRERDASAASWLRHSDRVQDKVCRMLEWPGAYVPPDPGNISADDARAWYLRNYRPSGMVLSICGPNAGRLMKAASEAFARYLPPEASSAEKGSGADASGGKAPVDKDKREAVALDYPLPGGGSRDYPAMLVARALLASGMGSEMFKYLRGTDPISYLFGSVIDYEASGPKLLLFATVPGEGVSGPAADRVLQAVGAVREDGITRMDFDRAKQYAEGELLMQESSASLARSAGLYEFLGLGPDYGEKLAGLIEKTGRQDVAKAAGRYLSNCGMVKLPLPDNTGEDSEAAR